MITNKILNNTITNQKSRQVKNKQQQSNKQQNNVFKNSKYLKVVCLAFVSMFSMLFIFACVNETNAQSYMRIHIRANSNSEADQNIKFLIKDQIVDFLTPTVANVESVAELKQVLQNNLTDIEKLTEKILKQNGFSYGASVSLNNELFPTRYYDGVLLPSDYYDAIIVNLGQSKGDNWWCVVYPPLCFVGEENTGSNAIIYKSKLLELVNKFFG